LKDSALFDSTSGGHGTFSDLDVSINVLSLRDRVLQRLCRNSPLLDRSWYRVQANSNRARRVSNLRFRGYTSIEAGT